MQFQRTIPVPHSTVRMEVNVLRQRINHSPIVSVPRDTHPRIALVIINLIDGSYLSLSVKDQCFFTPCQNGGTCSSTVSLFKNLPVRRYFRATATLVNVIPPTLARIVKVSFIWKKHKILKKYVNSWTNECISVYLACSSSPCKHGTCTNSGTSGQYTCACIAGWTGGDCDEGEDDTSIDV